MATKKELEKEVARLKRRVKVLERSHARLMSLEDALKRALLTRMGKKTELFNI